ncbi:MAG: hypothetical protein M4579_005601 [Chaenotheca gracillima]|nr:MAG: hypothetical protein M4579_005601 [Chaenotheca gracillima]
MSSDQTAAELPSTPVLGQSALPEQSRQSLAASPNAPVDIGGDLSSLEAPRRDGVKYSTPVPPISSMTPPPSSQVPRRDISLSPSPVAKDEMAGFARTPGPVASLFSSPPLTTLNDTLRPADLPSDQSYKPPAPEEISTASSAELKSMLETSIKENERLSALCQEARTSAAHYKLQHNLLSIETEEAVKRMNVEYEMSRREVEALQKVDHSHQFGGSLSRSGSPLSQPNDSSVFGRLALDMKEECRSLKAEVDVLDRRLRKAKKLILHREGEIFSHKQENDQLRQRILVNREHLNQFRRPGGLFDTSPRQLHASPSNKTRPDDSIDAILLADQVLNHGTATAPSTPMRSHNVKTGRSGHNRGAHSLSSLPSTPIQRRPRQPPRTHDVQPMIIDSPRGRSASTMDDVHGSSQRRRQSRDSTISASDQEDHSHAPFMDEYDNGSPASQMATKMLRRSAEQAGQIPRTPKGKPNKLVQPKLFGQVKKPVGQRIVHLGLGNSPNVGMEDAHESAGADAHRAKKFKANPGVGLGIGNWNPTSSS